MDTVKATYKAKMGCAWFLEFIQQLAQDNQPRIVEITDCGLKLHFNGSELVYSFTSIFDTIKAVPFEEWLKEFDAFTDEVRLKS